jgi:hypothetical protein
MMNLEDLFSPRHTLPDLLQEPDPDCRIDGVLGA